jgi:diguanylate cyclase (GGDEF)-like protein/PAS domain S-box-containing protein
MRSRLVLLASVGLGSIVLFVAVRPFLANASTTGLAIAGAAFSAGLLGVGVFRQREDAARLELELANRSLANAIEGIARLDPDGRYIAVNGTYARIAGYEHDELIGLSWEQTVSTADIPKGIEAYQQMRNFGRSEVELRGRRKDGNLYYKQVMLLRLDQDGAFAGHHCFVRDITQRKQVEEELRRQTMLFQSVLDCIGDGVIVADREGELVLVNPAARALMPRGVQSLPGELRVEAYGVLSCDEKTPVDVHEMPLARAIAGHAIDGLELFVKNETLNGRHISVTARPLRNDQGEIVGGIASLHDVTMRRSQEAELRTANDRLAALLSTEQSRADEVSLLGEMSQALHSCLTRDEATEVIARAMKRLFTGTSGALYLLSEDRSMLESRAKWGDRTVEPVFGPHDCWALRRGRVHDVEELTGDLRCPHSDCDERTVCVPLVVQSEILGVLHLRTKGDAARESRLITPVSEQIALGLGNIRLREQLRLQAIRDPLTGLFNRRVMEESLQREVRRGIRKKRPLSLLMIDLDHFKQVNDRFGHHAGDAVLGSVGALLSRFFRSDDVVCRYGGEEFVVILPEATLGDGAKRAGQLLEAIRGLEVESAGAPLPYVTASIGMAVLPEDAEDADALLKAADAALYRAKREGRDRVVLASGDLAINAA